MSARFETEYLVVIKRTSEKQAAGLDGSADGF